MHLNDLSSSIYDSQDTETIEMSPERWTDKEDVVYMYNKYCTAMKKNEVMPFIARWTDLEIIIWNEVNQTEKETYHMISLICGI